VARVSDDLEGLVPRVPARPCTGRLTTAGQPRHPRPAGISLELGSEYGFDYSLPRDEPLNLRPLLDLVAADYDGCTTCHDQQLQTVLGSPALIVHAAGVALMVLTPIGMESPAEYLVDRLNDTAAAVVLTLRSHGLAKAVALVSEMDTELRQEVIARVLGVLLPTQWYHWPLSHRFDPARPRQPREDDQAALRRLVWTAASRDLPDPS
jgi:hypothetical protein